jgi:hypothetical protein
MSHPPTPPKPQPPRGGPVVLPAGAIPQPRWPEVVLACSGCQKVWSPAPEDFDTGQTGCPLCGGWTYIASTEPYIPTPRPEG